MKKITLLVSFAMLLVVAGCGKGEEATTPAATTGTAATTPPPAEPGGAQRQGGLQAPTLNQGAGNVDSFGSKSGG